jgi:hypothetical protein
MINFIGFHRPLIKEIVAVSKRDGKADSWIRINGIGFKLKIQLAQEDGSTIQQTS